MTSLEAMSARIHPNDTVDLVNPSTATSLEETQPSQALPSFNETNKEYIEGVEEEKKQEPVHQSRGLKVLFLSSDTGGGHRASAESLAKQFELLFPGSTYELLDLATEHYPPPYSRIVSNYKHLSRHPSQWKVLYGFTNNKYVPLLQGSIKFVSFLSERAIRKKIKSIQPDVVVSVHPLQTSVPILSCAKISHETGKHLPIFTVVTDLGSGHVTWFANGMETMFVGSKQIYDLARQRGNVPPEKLVQLGLPIRHDFAVQAERMGDRTSPQGKEYQAKIRRQLNLPGPNRKTLLVMGGGEGVGSLSNIVDSLYCELVQQNIPAIILVVCGRNQKLQQELEERDWDEVVRKSALRLVTRTRPTRIFHAFRECSAPLPTGCIEAGAMTTSLRRVLSSGNFSLSSSNTPLFTPTLEQQEDLLEEEKTDYGATATTTTTAATTPSEGGLQIKSMSFGALDEYGNTSLFDQDISESKEGEEQHAIISVTDSEREEEEEEGPLILPMSPPAPPPQTKKKSPKVDVIGLGFVTNMAEYMVAADILVSKAGPGTISEAAALSLPVLLTSYLPGQEEGNVDYVVDGQFGAYVDDSDPHTIAEEIADWLLDETKWKKMADAAKQMGAPHAARDIVQQIGNSTLKWRELNDRAAAAAAAAAVAPSVDRR